MTAVRRILHGRTVVPGVVEGEALVSHEPISGWGGIDPARGVIIERRHELFEVCFTGKILVFPSAKGSSGWSGFFQTTRLSGTAPIGMVIGRISAKSALGAVVTRVPGRHRPRRRPVRGHRHRRLAASRQLNSGGNQAMTGRTSGARPPRGRPDRRARASGLRSNYEPGTSRWATRRAQWLALGLSDEDMVKPKIAIVNTSSQLAICFSHLDEIARRAKRAIELAGGIGFEIRTAAPSDFIHSAGHRGGYILSARDLITNDIEMQVEGAQLDGMICLASCDKTAPGQLMAAARLNIPTIMVACGYQASGSYRGRHCDIEDVFLAAGHVASGRLDASELTEMSANAVLSPGVCAGIGTANTMHLACEALGMALPGSTPVRANSEPMWRAVDAAAARIVEMVAEDLRPRDIMTPAAFANAVTAILSVSGSINSVKHLQAVAAEAECRRGRLPAVRDAGRRRAAAHRDQAQRRDVDRGVRGRGRHPGDHEAARAAAGRRRAHRHR